MTAAPGVNVSPAVPAAFADATNLPTPMPPMQTPRAKRGPLIGSVARARDVCSERPRGSLDEGRNEETVGMFEEISASTIQHA